jgi:hypothetical protein
MKNRLNTQSRKKRVDVYIAIKDIWIKDQILSREQTQKGRYDNANRVWPIKKYAYTIRVEKW